MKPGSSPERVVLESDSERADLQDMAECWARSNLAPLEPDPTDSRHFTQFELGDGLAQYLDDCIAPVEMSEFPSKVALHVLKFADVIDPSSEYIRTRASEMLTEFEQKLKATTHPN